MILKRNLEMKLMTEKRYSRESSGRLPSIYPQGDGDLTMGLKRLFCQQVFLMFTQPLAPLRGAIKASLADPFPTGGRGIPKP